LPDVDPDAIAAACHGFVDAVVGDLDQQVMQAALIRAADVHTGAAADGFEAFEDLNIGGGILFFGGLSACGHDGRNLPFQGAETYLTSLCARAGRLPG
jgi:hypothetical protein